jgi:hypothetical protein
VELVIVDPDFLDHWRTRMVVDALDGDEFAPFYLLRLWAHCQSRKATRFDIPAAGLKGLCKAACDAAKLEAVLIEAGFIARDGAHIEVLKWAEKNASLIAAWENGSKGGRPSKPNQNPRVTDGKPTGNPEETQGKPGANPGETDKRGSDKTSSPSLRSGEETGSRLPKPFVLPDDWRSFCQAERPELDPDKVAAKLADYWYGKPGKTGKKSDWPATWRNWVRDERGPPRLASSASSDPAWRIEQRQRTQLAAPGVAAHHQPATDFFDTEAIDVTTRRLG